MNGPNAVSNSQSLIPTPRASLQNVGEKRDEDEKDRNGHSFQAFGPDGFTFLDFLDVINPLQHIPGVSTLYRHITGDEIDPGSRIAGGTLFGGPVGTVVSMANVSLEHRTGQDMGEHLMSWFNGDEALETGVQLANSPPPSDFVTAAGGNDLALNPIATNMEVLEWAQRETARSLNNPDIPGEAKFKAPPPVPTVATTDIAGNIVVLNWARRESALSRSSVETADATLLDKKKAEQRARIDNVENHQDKTLAMGRGPAQMNGAVAPNGGWFSETMLLALTRYDEGSQLGKSGQIRRIEETLDISQ